MKSMQRRFGGMMKRSADEADVGQILTEFKQVDEMLSQLTKDLTAYRNSWDDILKLQYDCSEALVTLYKPIGPLDDPEQRSQPTETPQGYMQKCLGLQKLYSELKTDLLQELSLIDQKLIRPVETAREGMKMLHKTLKHRDNTKLDYEKYMKRVEHAGRKDTRSAKEEAALASHEQNATQAKIDYQTADEQVKQTFPPVIDAVMELSPFLLASQIMLQTTLVGQVYTVLDRYTKTHRMSNPAPGNEEIVGVWEQEFTGFRKELEQGLQTISQGKVVHQSMDLPMEKGKTYTGLGLRNKAGGATSKVGGMMGRKGSAPPSVPQKPSFGRQGSAGSGQLAIGNGDGRDYGEEEEMAPPKPPRPGGAGGSIPATSPYGMPSPGIPVGSKPRIPSVTSPLAPPYDRNSTGTPASSWLPEKPPPSYEQAAGQATPPSRYATPLGTSAAISPPYPTNTNGPAHAIPSNPQDYFAAHRRISQSSAISSLSSTSAAAAKKKAAPPIPVKRVPSQQQTAQYVTALYDFEAQNDGDLAFREGDRIRILVKTGSVDDWWEGECRGQRGSFPANYVEV
ncbi:hypothetical protein LTR78_008132 [Recurvomyces mirabilis]|uniref:SH3 domain-containing protein n=1 Tax=Recurvomyces mirabilis TaxID=574656 RepID=A0AAE0WIZ8_9PEZI|nr:hypothetical protein LTR78_008132 [Recurvomyces mirabilis]KAK5150667.1 hypothetical protein LTS14_009950 [Recurvomyces mirabilis]